MHPRLCSMAPFTSTLCASCSQKYTEALCALPTTHVMYSSAPKTLLPLPHPALGTWLWGGVLVSTAQPRSACWRGEAIFAGVAPWLSTTCWDKSGTCWGCRWLQLLPSLDSLCRWGGLFHPCSRTCPCPSVSPQGTHGRSPIAPAPPTSWGSAFRFCVQQRQGKNLSLSGAGRGPKGAQTHVRSAPMENAARKGQDAGWAGELYGLVPVLPVSSAPAFLSLCSYRSSLQSVIERRLPQHHCARTAAVCARVPVRCWSLHTPPCPCPVGAMGYPCLPPQHPLPLEDKEGGEKVR